MKYLLPILFLLPLLSIASEPYQVLRANTLRLNVGTGFLYKGEKGTYIITNWHVCIWANEKGTIYGRMPNGQLYIGDFIKDSPTADLCAAKVFPSPKMGIELAPSILPKSRLWTRGYADAVLTESTGELDGQVTWSKTFAIEELGECPKESHTERGINGRIYGCTIEYTDNLTSLFARPGASGSPVVDAEGKLVGVISSYVPMSKYSAGMVPFRYLKDFLKGL